MKTVLKRALPLLLLVGLIVLGLRVWVFEDKPLERDRLTLFGNVDIREVALAFNGSERIAAIRVEEGQAVRKGDLLAELETRRLTLAVERNAARVEAQARLVEKLLAGTRKEEILQARAQAEAVRQRAESARRTYERLRPLAAGNLASRDRIDTAKALADSENASLTAAVERLNQAERGPRKEDIASARATLRVLAAELDISRQNLADANLVASDDGVIRNRILEPGDMASPGRPVLTLALTDPVWVRTYVSETDLGRIHPGMPATVKTDSFPDKDYPAWIGYISPTAEFTPKTVETADVRTHLVYQVRVFVCNPANELRLGMPATVVIPLHPASNAPESGPPPCGDRGEP
ncbi:efflux RND transporter periplasmic adaptor subunit [Desulfococcus sp.]|uniref:efflux RND transporter periplasmic adaptor subunit n=1 Tax=Desulfococcus sp. TaxID=2025834 RepID=UPI003593F6AB